MKNQIKPIIAALLLGTTTLANASTLPAKPTIKPYAFNMYKVDGKAAINLFINKMKGTKMHIVIKDDKGNKIFEDGMFKNETMYRTKINFEALEKGIYYLEMTDGNNTEIKKLEI